MRRTSSRTSNGAETEGVVDDPGPDGASCSGVPTPESPRDTPEGLIFGSMNRRATVDMHAELVRATPPVIDSPGRSPVTNHRRALVLNATYEPLGIVPSRRALLLVLGTKAEMVHSTARVFRSERVVVPEPSVVRLIRYVHLPRQYRVAVNRRTVFARDESRCQYCGGAAENLDHIIPRSKGGPHTWENVVAACRRCNTRKEDRLPHEAGMVLRTTPIAPRHRLQLLAMFGGGSEDWRIYLGGNVDRLEPMTA
jgi:5-methylcytosine-specific restriction endonuclease McrA